MKKLSKLNICYDTKLELEKMLSKFFLDNKVVMNSSLCVMKVNDILSNKNKNVYMCELKNPNNNKYFYILIVAKYNEIAFLDSDMHCIILPCMNFEEVIDCNKGLTRTVEFYRIAVDDIRMIVKSLF